jgi:hypothetical protein
MTYFIFFHSFSIKIRFKLTERRKMDDMDKNYEMQEKNISFLLLIFITAK